MNLKSLRTLTISACLLTWIGCSGGGDYLEEANTPPNLANGPGGPGEPGPGPGRPGGEWNSSPIRAIMVKLDRGPSALHKSIGNALRSDSPDWVTLQKQSSEYAGLATELGKLDPPRGSKESWVDLTAALVESASSLDRSAQSKDRAAALKAHEELSGSCMGCHREHRSMQRGRGLGGPPGGMMKGFPGGGPPPGGGPRPGNGPTEGSPPGGGPPLGGPPPR
jgi:hypothetical protein